jgi:hypothetical protein
MRPVTLSSGREAGIKCHAAIDKQRGAGDIVGSVRGEPRTGAADILGLANPLIRHKLHQIGIVFGGRPDSSVDRRTDRAWGNGVNANPVWRDCAWRRMFQISWARGLTPN